MSSPVLVFRILRVPDGYKVEAAIIASFFDPLKWERIRGIAADEQTARDSFAQTEVYNLARQVGVVVEVAPEEMIRNASGSEWGDLPVSDMLSALNGATLTWYQHLYPELRVRIGHERQEEEAREIMLSWVAAINLVLAEAEDPQELISVKHSGWLIVPVPPLTEEFH